MLPRVQYVSYTALYSDGKSNPLLTPSEGFGEFVVVNGVLFYGSAVAGAGALAGGVAGGVGK